MNIAMTIKSIEDLTKEFDGKTRIEKLIIYSTIQTLVSELKTYATWKKQDGFPIPNADILIAEIITPLRGLAGLEDNSHNDSQNSSWVRIGLEKIRSENCFNVPK